MTEIDPEKKRAILLTAKRFKKIRLQLKMTQPQMAEMLSFETGAPIGVKSIYCWEKGERPVPGWVIDRAELLQDEHNRIETKQAVKGSVIRNKQSLMDAVVARVKELLKSE